MYNRLLIPYTKIFIAIALFALPSCNWFNSPTKEVKHSIKRENSTISNSSSSLLPIAAIQDSAMKQGQAEYEKSGIPTMIDSFRKVFKTNDNGLIGRYQYIYDAVNGFSFADSINTNEVQWDSINNTYYLKYKNKAKLAIDREVFGWHPYFMGTSYESYNYDLLSTVAFFSYNVNPSTGLYQDESAINIWRTTPLVDSVKSRKDKKILLTATCHGKSKNSTFLQNEFAQNTMIDTLVGLVLERGAHGVDIDFENIPGSRRTDFTNFIQKVRDKLNSVDSSNLFLNITIPSFDHTKAFDIKALTKIADQFVIMGYDFHGQFGSNGPVAPLKSQKRNDYSLETSVDKYLKKGIPKKKLVLALPYYGAVWSGLRTADGEVDLKFEKYLSYRAIQDNYAKLYKPNFDKASDSYYFLIEDTATNIVEEIWFDNDTSLSKKFNWINAQGIKGVGIWALGYDNKYQELWQVIDKTMTGTGIAIKDVGQPKRGKFYEVSKTLGKYRNVAVAVAALLLLFIAAGLSIALVDWRVRQFLFESQFFRIAYLLLGFIIVLSLFALFGQINNQLLNILMGMIIGVALWQLILRYANQRKSEIP